jgi:predicted nucleic acid-binding Zn ribbon protein
MKKNLKSNNYLNRGSMLCPICLIEREDKLFLGKEICYKCMYAQKVAQANIRKCKECGEPIPGKRWTYCSDKCGKIALKTQKKEHWTKVIR